MTVARRRRNVYAGAVAAVVLVIGAVVGLYVGGPGDVVGSGGVTPPPAVLLELFAPRDVGRLPIRSSWCTIARNADHCWLMQESSGNAIDTGSATELWDLTPAGSPRQGVVASLPVADATGFVDTSSEAGVWFDGGTSTKSLEKTGVANLPDATNLVFISAVIDIPLGLVNSRLLFFGDGAAQYQITILGGGNFKIQAEGPTTTKVVTVVQNLEGRHCVTFGFDGRTSNAASAFFDGADVTPASPDLSGTGSWRTVGGAGEDVVVGNLNAPTSSGTFPGAVYRMRIDFAALTLADHQAICGSLWDFELSATTTKVVAADLTYTQTGGDRCFEQSATTAVCVPGGSPGHVRRSGLGLAWAIEPDRTNRILDSRDLSTGNWAGDATTLAVVAPDGSLTGYDTFVDDASSISAVPTGYTASVDVFPRLWVKCATGALLMGTDGAAAGSWTIDCSAVGGEWTELDDTSPAVTENTQFAADSSGDATIIFSADATGVSFQAWMPTLAEVRGLSVIRTEGAAVATGTITWKIDNDPAVYYEGANGKITITADYLSGACVDVSSGTQVGRQFGDAVDWLAFDSSSATAYIANLALLGIDTAVIRWDSAAVVDGANFAEILLNGIPQTFDATPLTGWTAASPTEILLDGHTATSCTAAIQTIRIEDGP